MSRQMIALTSQWFSQMKEKTVRQGQFVKVVAKPPNIFIPEPYWAILFCLIRLYRIIGAFVSYIGFIGNIGAISGLKTKLAGKNISSDNLT